MQLLFGATPRHYNIFDLANASALYQGFDIGTCTWGCSGYHRGVAFVLMVLLWFLVNRTRTGKAMRATSMT